jgi:predicted nucleic acid-binding protein
MHPDKPHRAMISLLRAAAADSPPHFLSEPCYMTDTLTIAEKLKEAGFSEVQASALTRAIEAAAAAKAELVEARMNKDLAAVIERSDAKFEQTNAKFEAAIERTVREQTRWFATIVFSGIGVLIAILGLALHFR